MPKRFEKDIVDGAQGYHVPQGFGVAMAALTIVMGERPSLPEVTMEDSFRKDSREDSHGGTTFTLRRSTMTSSLPESPWTCGKSQQAVEEPKETSRMNQQAW
ncbi:hypothetical protein DOTSEDRAFT_44100 [Dothistroma septosporum NZE10]|uniref:Uncharacterized protein n=1 Tax=Dothistroma septosporum (strain NZE10 / CBS 128990) TaxID=675120 RepID=N1PR47_DOTSN|nr:hypothetical protein DOTSEDRAFT_44100 [Dothistroma septosporum NZE10]